MSWTVLLDAAEAVRAEAVAREPGIALLPLAGIGWATVEHERAELELDSLLGAAGPWLEIERDPALGARAWLRAPGVDGSSGGDDSVEGGGSVGGGGRPALVVLEPDTEGRLAASLARFGEGVAVAYLGAKPPARGRLVPGGPAWGPYAVVLHSGVR